MALVDPDCFEGLSTQEQLQQIFEAAREIAINGGGGGGPFQPLSAMLTALSTGDGSGLTSVPGSSLTGGFTASGMTMSTDRLLGRDTAGSGPVEEISLGTGFALSGGSLVTTFTQTGTGAVARTYDAKFKDWVSVKDFGAVGDDSTDDTAAIQLAYDTGKSVFWPEGTYKITASIKPKSHGQMSLGSGQRRTIIKQYTAAAHAFELVAIAPPIHGGEAYALHWQDMTVLGPGTFNTGTAAFSGSTGDGFHLSRPGSTTYFTDHISLENVECELFFNCVYVAGCAQTTLIHCQLGYADRAVKGEGSSMNTFTTVGLVTSNCATNNIYMGAGVGWNIGLRDMGITAAVGSCVGIETATGVIATIIGGNIENRSLSGVVIKCATNSTLNILGTYVNRGGGTDAAAIDVSGTVTMFGVSLNGYTTIFSGSGRMHWIGPGTYTTSGTNALVGLGTGQTTPTHQLTVVRSSGTQVRLGTTTTNDGGYLWSGGANQLFLLGGVEHTGAYTARSTSASIVGVAGGQIEISTNSGLTAGNNYTPTLRFYVSPAGKVMRRVVGTTDAGIGGTLPVDTTQTGNVGTGEDTLQSATVTGGLLANNGETYEFTCAGTIANNANAKRIRAKFGATTIFDSGALPTGAAIEWSLNCKVTRTGAATQKCISVLNTNNATAPAIVDYATAAETLSGNVTALVTGEAVDNNDIVKEMYIPSFKAQ